MKTRSRVTGRPLIIAPPKADGAAKTGDEFQSPDDTVTGMTDGGGLVLTRAAAAWAGMLWRFGLFGLFGLCGGGLDGVDRDEWNCEQLVDTRDVVGAGRAG